MFIDSLIKREPSHTSHSPINRHKIPGCGVRIKTTSTNGQLKSMAENHVNIPRLVPYTKEWQVQFITERESQSAMLSIFQTA